MTEQLEKKQNKTHYWSFGQSLEGKPYVYCDVDFPKVAFFQKKVISRG